jgi:hypothetical protein
LVFGENCNFLDYKRKLLTYGLRTLGDVARLLETGEHYEPDDIDEEDFDLEDDPHGIQLMLLREAHKNRARKIAALQDKHTQLYALIIATLSSSSLDVVKQSEGYTEINDTMDVKELWSTVVATHKLTSLSTVLAVQKLAARQHFNTIRQGPYEKLVTYKERWDEALDNYQHFENVDIPAADLAMDFLASLCSVRYGEYRTDLENDVNKGTMEMPATVSDMYQLICGYKAPKSVGVGSRRGTGDSVFTTMGDDSDHDAHTHRRLGERGGGRGATGGKKTEKKVAGKDKKPKKGGPKKAKKSFTCWECGEEGHAKYECPKLKDDDEDALVQMMYAGVFATPTKLELEPWEVLLDNCSQISIMGEEFLTDIQRGVTNRNAGGIGGSVTVTDDGDLEDFFRVFVRPKGCKAVNVLCLADVRARYPISLEDDGSMTVHMSQGDLVFHMKDKMCIGDMRRWMIPRSVQTHATTVTENMGRYSKLEVKKAQMAHEFLKTAGFPSQATVIALARDGNIMDVPITAADIRRAYDIYGKPAASVRGMTTKKKVSRAAPDDSLKLDQDTQQWLFTDIFYVRQLPFLMSLVHPLELVIVTQLRAPRPESADNIGLALQNQLTAIRSHGFRPTRVFADPQRGLAALVGQFAGVEIDISGAGDHIDRVDVRIRRLKEIIRSVQSDIPWEIPTQLIPDLVSYATSRANLRAPQSGQSKVCPRVAFTGVKPSYRKELGLSFGDYVECYDPKALSKNAEKDRTEPCIALFPTANCNGSWWMFNMKTTTRIRRSQWQKMVTTQLVMDTMNSITKAERDALKTLDPDRANEEAEAIAKEAAEGIPVLEPGSEHSEGEEKNGTIDAGVPVQHVFEHQHDVGNLVPPELPADLEPLEHGGDLVMEDDNPDDDDDDPPALVEDDSDDDDEEGSPVPPLRRSTRSNIGKKPEYSRTFHISVKKGIREYGSAAEDAIEAELRQLAVDRDAWTPVHPHSLTAEQKRKALRSLMFLDVKYDAMGNFDKIKGRLVGNGAQQDRALYDNISSPTAMLQSLMMTLTIAASERRKMAAIDIKGAYLHASLPNGEGDPVVIMMLDATMSETLAKIDPRVLPFIGADGKLYVRLDKALYGCVQSARLWYERITVFLKGLGFEHNETDPCVMNLMINGIQLTIVIYVDDVLALSQNEDDIKWLVKQLSDEFGDVKYSDDLDVSYLGMHIRIVGTRAIVSMKAYSEALIEEAGVTGVAASPALGTLFQVGNTRPLGVLDKKKYHRLTAKLLYLAKREKPSLLLAVSYLTTRVLEPNEADMVKLYRALKYLNLTKDQPLILSAETGLRLEVYVDAAFALHEDGKSHTGMVVKLGEGSVLVKSSKQKIVTKDSTEAELVALSDRMNDALQCGEFMASQGYPDCAVPVMMQDNTSTITLVTKGGGKFRTRHLKVRINLIKERYDAGDIGVQFTKTIQMWADLLTKPLQGALLRMLVAKVMGYN